jgi:hypothetical protein
MNIDFVTDPDQVPKSREDIRIVGLVLEPYPDGRRVRVAVRLTPFAPADRPNLDIRAFNADNTEVSSLSIIEMVQHALAVTVHLRERSVGGQFTFRADLYYDPAEIQHSLTQTLVLPGDIAPTGVDTDG